MTDNPPSGETFEAFRKSFFYGSRNDLNFKFLAELSDEEAADFLQALFEKIGQFLDDGDAQRLIEHVIAGQKSGYRKQRNFAYEDGPFCPFEKSLSEARIGLLTSSGHFVEGQDPEPLGVKNMSQEEAVRRVMEFLKEEPVLSAIPIDIPMDKLRVRHGGYDIHGVMTDANVAFPIDRMKELEAEGVIGEMPATAWSFVGACSQKRLLKQTGPRWVHMLKEYQLDAMILVPV